jgi:hypothetical protein
MRAHPLNLLIAVLASALLTYAMTTVDANTIKGSFAVGSFILLSSTLGTMIGLEFRNGRTAVNLKVLAGVYFVVGLALQVVFCLGQFSQTSYVVVNGVAFLSFVLFANAVYSARH